MTKRILSILFTFWVSIQISCFAEPLVAEKTRLIETITNLDGLSHNNVHCVFQDSKGFLWIGTSAGLNRYDGKTFQVFKNDPQNSKTISSNNIYGICEDQNQNIWVATEYGFNQITRDSYECNRFYLDSINNYSLEKNLIQNIFCDNEGNIWIKSITSISHFILRTGEIKSYALETDIFRNDYEVNSYPIFQDSNGILWIGTENGLGYYEPLYDDFIFFKNDSYMKNSLSSNNVRSIYEDSHHNLWIGTQNGLNLFNKKTQSFTSYFYSQKIQSNVNGIAEGYAPEGHSSNKLWITTESNGLYYFDINAKQFYEFNIHTHQPTINTNNCIAKSKDNILWIGTQNGLNKLDIKPKLFQTIRNEAEDIPSNYNNTTAIYSMNDLVFIGTKYRGLHIYDLKQESRKTYSANNGNFPSNHITCLEKLSKNELLIGSEEYLTIYNTESQTFQPIDKKYPELHSFSLAKKRIRCLLFDTHKNLWIGTNFGIIRFNTATRAITHYDNEILPSNQILCLYEDHKGSIFIGCENTICYYNYRFDSFRNIDISKLFTSRSRQHIYDMTEDYNGNIWIATNVGLLKLESNTLECSLYKEDFAFDEIYSLLMHQDEIWMGTNNGLIKFSIKEKTSKIFSVLDGIQDYEFSPHAAFKLPNDFMFFGGIQGVNFFHPDSIKTSSRKPNLELLEIEYTFENARHKIYIKDGIEVSLPWQSSNIILSFAVLDFTQPHLNQYKYTTGTTQEWTDLGNRNFINIIKPNIGVHNFKIQGANSEGVWSNIAEIKITVPPPFWKTTLANIIKILLIIGIIVIAVIRIRKRIEHQRQEIIEHERVMEQLERQQLELEDKNKNILDSITYAKRIQMAIMPARAKFRHTLPSSFILYMPKDIVSGDFYWISEVDSKIFIGCADCTGHGVPGAFMSIIGNNLLRSVTKDIRIHRASEILDFINKSLIELLSKNELDDDSSVKDGMDISICVFDKETCVLEFAGALTRMLIVRDRQLLTIRGDKFPVGLNNDRDDTYTNVVIRVLPDDRFYLFTDGYADQFGGEHGKKLKFKKFKENVLMCQDLPLIKQGNELKKQLLQWQGNWEQIDDVLVMGFDCNVFLEEKKKRDAEKYT
jgi:ligand-binding sensor domain-containing protein/serine phosphatase RsbU (regulator of sigma subunit)